MTDGIKTRIELLDDLMEEVGYVRINPESQYLSRDEIIRLLVWIRMKKVMEVDGGKK
jgi:hypothetical protein